MLVIDRREKDIEPYLKPYGVSTYFTELEFGDYYWTGNGPDGEDSMTISWERKKIPDLVTSMRDRRLHGRQLSGMLRSFDKSELVIEGFMRPGNDGQLEILKKTSHGNKWIPYGGVMYREVDHYLSSAQYKLGVSVHRTSSTQETAALIVSRYKWWTEKTWNQHKSMDGIYAPEPNRIVHGSLGFGKPPNLVTKMAAQIDGMDYRAYLAGDHFDLPIDMCRAGANEWKSVLGFKGKISKLADSIVEQLRGRIR